MEQLDLFANPQVLDTLRAINESQDVSGALAALAKFESSDKAARRAEQDRRDHQFDHARRPLASCQLCRAAHEASRSLYSGSSYCPAVGHIFEGQIERQLGNGAWGRGYCPTCSRRISITRPTKQTPWSLVGSHRR